MDSIAAGPRPTDEATAGVEANARLTAITGLVLLVLFVIEIVTVALKPRSVLTLHTVVGLMLIPPVVVKLGSTVWRMISYYRGVPAYQRKGPPPLWLRVLGPVLGVLTIMVLASGVVLVVGPHPLYGVALFIHLKIFYFWLTAIGLHAAAHMVSAVRWAYRDVAGRLRRSTPGSRQRLAIVFGCVVLGTALGVVLAGHAATYLLHYPVKR
jgi:hypothetical protein